MTASLAALPVVDLGAFLNGPSDPAAQDACRLVADCLRDTGALVVRDPRVSYADNSRFLDMMERYFGQTHDEKMRDCRPEIAYQARACMPDAAPPRSA
jgi:hypothetical protein